MLLPLYYNNLSKPNTEPARTQVELNLKKLKFLILLTQLITPQFLKITSIFLQFKGEKWN